MTARGERPRNVDASRVCNRALAHPRRFSIFVRVVLLVVIVVLSVVVVVLSVVVVVAR